MLYNAFILCITIFMWYSLVLIGVLILLGLIIKIGWKIQDNYRAKFRQKRRAEMATFVEEDDFWSTHEAEMAGMGQTRELD